MRPRIGVTVSTRSGWRIFPLMALNVWLAGGRAVKWVRESDVDLASVQGIVVGGGDDISPELYGGQSGISIRLDPARDAFEKALIRDAFEAEMPILGICRGAQMLNIALGGTLDQDAYATYGSRKYKTILPRKTVSILEETRLGLITGGGEMQVNALHSQSVDQLGRGLRIAARDDGGMPQAIERVRDPFCLGVQWHPEHLFAWRRHRAIFRALVAAARAADGGQVEAVDAAAKVAS